jgi:molybdopterin converting factor small subunit
MEHLDQAERELLAEAAGEKLKALETRMLAMGPRPERAFKRVLKAWDDERQRLTAKVQILHSAKTKLTNK